MSDLEFELSLSLKVKSNGAVRLPVYDVLLLSTSKHMSIILRLAVHAVIVLSSPTLSLIIGPNFHVLPTLPRGDLVV